MSQEILKFAAFESFVQDTFWHKLAELKLDQDRLSDAPKLINGFYTNRNAKSCLLEVDYTAFNGEFKPPKFCHPASGTLYNKNTVEEFKDCDKSALLQIEGQKFVADLLAGRILEEPSLLARFLLLSFGDLKSHSYYYWFAFPCPLITTLHVLGSAHRLSDVPQLQPFKALLSAEPVNFSVIKVNDASRLYTLREVLGNGAGASVAVSPEDYYFCFADASEYEHPAWLMRTFAAFLFYQCPQLVGKRVQFLGVRMDAQMQTDQSLLWHVQQSEPIDLTGDLKFVGWEPNRNQKMAPRFVNMEATMDPAKLAESYAHLNLKLMKWRLVPELNLESIEQTKCLLFGAGTLGCAVARNLLGWGFRQLTFVDSGKVGHSNPVRQCLYTHADAAAGNRMKAPTAAERIREINPGTIATGHVIQIPMPGHTVGESMRQRTEQDLATIRDLVAQHDVLILLTDSRESRWLPTLLGAAQKKIVINAALGFDSYLVMRHGYRLEEGAAAVATVDIGDLKCIDGTELGCYFCNDVTAPGNSLRERTLDQQCTVTRPGVSNIAASYAVELLVSLLQHPGRATAPAYYSPTTARTASSHSRVPEGLLGIIPHSIRGLLCNYENILPATQRFTQCIACSQQVLAAYAAEGDAFLFRVFETAKCLEDLTGISQFRELDSEIIDYNDSELEMSDED